MATAQTITGPMTWDSFDNARVEMASADAFNFTWDEWERLSDVPPRQAISGSELLLWNMIDESGEGWDDFDKPNLTWDEWDALADIPLNQTGNDSGILQWNKFDKSVESWDYLDKADFTWDERERLANIPPKQIAHDTGKLLWDMIEDADKDWDYLDELEVIWDEWDVLTALPRYVVDGLIEINTKAKEKLYLAVSGEGVNTFKHRTMRLSYTPIALELNNFAAHTNGIHNGAGKSNEAGLIVSDSRAGKAVFLREKAIACGFEWCGLVTLLAFMGKESVKTAITLSDRRFRNGR